MPDTKSQREYWVFMGAVLIVFFIGVCVVIQNG